MCSQALGPNDNYKTLYDLQRMVWCELLHQINNP